MSQRKFIGSSLVLVGFLFVLVAILLVGQNAITPAPSKPHIKVYIFGADWCQYCPKKAEVERIQEKYPDFDVYDIDIDKPKNESEKEFLSRFRPNKIPLFIVCSDKGCWTTRNRPEFDRWLNELAGKNNSGRK